jgi:hypothetical protein
VGLLAAFSFLEMPLPAEGLCPYNPTFFRPAKEWCFNDLPGQ